MFGQSLVSFISLWHDRAWNLRKKNRKKYWNRGDNKPWRCEQHVKKYDFKMHLSLKLSNLIANNCITLLLLTSEQNLCEMALVKNAARNGAVCYHHDSKEMCVLLCLLLPQSPTLCWMICWAHRLISFPPSRWQRKHFVQSIVERTGYVHRGKSMEDFVPPWTWCFTNTSLSLREKKRKKGSRKVRWWNLPPEFFTSCMDHIIGPPEDNLTPIFQTSRVHRSPKMA